MPVRILFILYLLFYFEHQTKAQTFWTNTVGGNNVDEALGVTKDPTGNIISAGYFTNSCNFGLASPLVSSSTGVPDIYVQKMAPGGATIWAVKAGGSGSDRATSVKTDSNGDIYITGFYYGTATFGSFTLSSVNGSQDIFIAKINSSGVFQWAVSAGGSLGDYSYGIALDQNNNVFITGQFEGTATFGSQSLTSQINPATNLPSFDIFTAKYDAGGVFQWVKQGKAEYNDRGMDLVCDNNGNVYVTGQFSDTITFQNTYNNNVMNAVFIIKYNSSGQEVWFRRAAGSFGIGYAICLYNNQDLYIAGDFKGTMTFFGTPNNFLTDVYTNRIFLAKYTTSGNFVWAQSDASDNYLSARAICNTPSGDILLGGEFGCVMNEYSNLYGPGVFNSVGYSDIFACKYTSAGVRDWERHVGGPAVDKIHGLTERNNRPVMAGSYEHQINFPVNNSVGMNVYPYSNSIPWSGGGGNYCADISYSSFAGVIANGFSDCFVSDGIDISRQPYDFYVRNGINCIRPQLDVCIEGGINPSNCPDTINLCGSDYIHTNLHQLGYGISPYYHYNWSPMNSNDTLNNVYINNSGYYSVEVNSYDNCYTNEDTVYVSVGNMPFPTITDDHGINLNHPPNAITIHACAPDTVQLTGGNIHSYSYSWNNTSPGVISSHDSVISVNQSGTYYFTLTAPNGCTTANMINIDLQQMSSIIPKSNMPDTFIVCQGQGFTYWLYDSITNPSGIIPYSNCFYNVSEHWYISPSSGLGGGGINTSCYLSVNLAPSITGSYIIKDSLKIQNLCGIETHCFIDTIYVIVNPNPVAYINIIGSQYICPADSTYLVATSSGPVNWNNGSTNDSLHIFGPGYYYASTSVTDSITGCSAFASDYLHVYFKPDPIISIVPWTGLICPNDSVLLQVNIPNAINYEWHGPMGIIPINSISIYVNIQGFYHCVVTDADGCILTSNTVEVKQYSTPYLIAQPSNILCPGQSATILVVTENTSSIQWQAPLSGSSPTQLITNGGTYYCNVSACGITTNCNIQIVQSNPVAIAFANGPTFFCPGDSVQLIANSGMTGYTWSPTNYNGQNYTVYNPGDYYVTTTDAYGCTAYSDTITVSWNLSVPPPTAIGDTVCAGDSIVLVANIGSGGLEWYPDFPSNNLLSTNDTLIISPLNNSTIFYVTTQNGSGCHSIWVAVNADVYATSLLPQIISDTIGCMGDSITITTNYILGASYNWTGPDSLTSILQTITINNLSFINQGYYNLYISGEGCTSPVATFELDVMEALPVFVSGDSAICENGSILLEIETQHQPSTIYFVDTVFNVQITPDSLYQESNLNAGVHNYSFFESYYGCEGPVNTYSVIVKPRPWLDQVTSNAPVCSGDSVLFNTTYYSNANYTWIGGNNLLSDNNTAYIVNSDTNSTGTYSVFAELDGCFGDTVYVPIIIYPRNYVYLGNDTIVCAEDNYILDAGSQFSYYLWDNFANTPAILIDSSRIYSIYVINNYGCSDYDSVYIQVINCDPATPNIFTPNKDGINEVFKINGDNFKEIDCIIFDRWGKMIYQWNDVNGYWDGSNMHHQEMPDGTYYYIANLTDFKGMKHELKGFIQLSK